MYNHCLMCMYHQNNIDTSLTGDFHFSGISEEQQKNKAEVGTLVLKTKMRNGCISFKDGEMKKWDEQWMPPGELFPLFTAQWANVAEADVEIYHVKETGAARVIIKELSNYSGIYAIIEYFYNIVTGIIDSVLSFFTQQNEPDCQNLSNIDWAPEEH